MCTAAGAHDWLYLVVLVLAWDAIKIVWLATTVLTPSVAGGAAFAESAVEG